LTIVSNASPLITICKLKLFHYLPALYQRLTIPDAVFDEVVRKGAGRPGAIEVSSGIKSGCIVRKQVNNTLAASALSKFLGLGESEAIILASETSADAVILDDNKARIVANSMNLHVTGTIGILLDLKQTGIIPTIRPFLDKAIVYGFRISPDIYNTILQKAGE